MRFSIPVINFLVRFWVLIFTKFNKNRQNFTKRYLKIGLFCAKLCEKICKPGAIWRNITLFKLLTK
jgi:hypothetical protein